MKILYVITGLGTGGAERALERLVLGLKKQGHEALVVSLGGIGDTGASLQAQGVTVCALGLRGGRSLVAGLLALRRTVRAFRPDIIQGWMYHGNLGAHLARLWARVPLFVSVRQGLPRGYRDKWLTRLVVRLDAWLSRFTSAVIYVSRGAAGEHEALGYASGRSLVIHNGFDTERFHPDDALAAQAREALGLSAGEKVVGAIGRFHPVKGYGRLLRAAEIVAREEPTLRLVLVGEGLTPDNLQVADLVTARGLERQCLLLGKRPDVERIIRSVDVLALASSMEGLPNVVGEAMASGVPCVVTRVGDVAELVGDTGWLVPVDADPQVLADALAEALSEGGQARVRRGREARQRVCNLFSMGQYVDRFVGAYGQALGQSTGLDEARLGRIPADPREAENPCAGPDV